MANDVFKSIDRKFPWSFLGFLTGVAFGVFGIYTVFFYAKAPDLKVELLSSAPVLSIRENVQDLEIMFKGTNIRQSHQALSLINIKLVNRGNVAIKSGDFDEKDPLILVVDEGEIVKADIIESSDSYLEKVYAETKLSIKTIRFPSFILEPSQFMSVRLLVLHSETVAPALSMKGKVANVGEIPVVLSKTEPSEQTTSSIAYSGDFVVQSIRVASYGIGTLAFLAAVIAIFVMIRDRLEMLHRRRHRLLTEARLDRFVESVPNKNRKTVKQLARLLASDGEILYMLRHELGPLMHFHKDLPEGELMANDRLKMLLRHFGMRSPEFDMEQAFSDKDNIKYLIEMLHIIDDK